MIGEAFQAVGRAMGNGFDAVVNFLQLVISAVNSAVDRIGNVLESVKDTIVSWLNTLFNAIRTGLQNVVAAVQEIVEGIANLFMALYEFFENLFSPIWEFFASIIEFFVEMISYINPFHENFILRVAFVPSAGFMEAYIQDFKSSVSSKFAVFGQIGDTMNALLASFDANVNNQYSITINLSNYGLGEMEIVNGTALAEYGAKMKFWIGGFMYFMTGMWLYRRLTSLLAEGK